ELLSGLYLMDIDLGCPVLPAFNPVGPQLATINWCASGRCEVDFGDKGSLVVGERTLCVSSTSAQSFSYPTGSYRGFEYFVDLELLDQRDWDVLEAFGLAEGTLSSMLYTRELGMNLVPSGELADTVHAISAELALDCPRHPWLLLHSCRLLMLLASTDLDGSRVTGTYLQRGQRDMAQAVYQQIVERMSPSADLVPLASRLGVSEASLRAYFERVYGTSPAAFARNRVLREAARLLAETARPVADIALACGYTNPSKFSAAFRREHGVNPLEYRRRSRLS
ncbi:MAG: AraC family transcriptional regulator, partial [Atopobiaceae bacterium]|nr:AraC family transcriptional regulator [Atopobiaceae bacterium]